MLLQDKEVSIEWVPWVSNTTKNQRHMNKIVARNKKFFTIL